MRLASLAIILFLTSPVLAITKVKVPTLPQSEWADTEVMTNVAINLSNSRTFSWRLEMDASPTNNVLIALGKDTNADGELTPSEWGTTLGWDCGAWFVRYEPTGWTRTIDANADTIRWIAPCASTKTTSPARLLSPWMDASS